jgi:hypothetical protein
MIVARGDFTVQSGKSLTLNNQTISSWAEVATVDLPYISCTPGGSGVPDMTTISSALIVEQGKTLSLAGQSISSWSAILPYISCGVGPPTTTLITSDLIVAGYSVGVKNLTLSGESINKWSDLSSYLPGSNLPYISCDETAVSTTISSDLTVEGDTTFSGSVLVDTDCTLKLNPPPATDPDSGQPNPAWSIYTDNWSLAFRNDMDTYNLLELSEPSLTLHGNLSVSGAVNLPNGAAANMITLTTAYTAGSYLDLSIGDATYGSMMDFTRSQTISPVGGAMIVARGDFTVQAGKSLTLNNQTISSWSDISGEEYYSKTQVDQMMADLRAEMAATYALK